MSDRSATIVYRTGEAAGPASVSPPATHAPSDPAWDSCHGPVSYTDPPHACALLPGEYEDVSLQEIANDGHMSLIQT